MIRLVLVAFLVLGSLVLTVALLIQRNFAPERRDTGSAAKFASIRVFLLLDWTNLAAHFMLLALPWRSPRNTAGLLPRFAEKMLQEQRLTSNEWSRRGSTKPS